MIRLEVVTLLALAAVQPGLSFTSSRVQMSRVLGLRDHGDAAALTPRILHGLRYGLCSTSASISYDEPSNPSSELATAAAAPTNATPEVAKTTT